MYGIVSDIHLNSWSAFATIDGGINSRLKTTLEQLVRAAALTKQSGGKRLYCAGDFFHKRGEIEPAVLNPTMRTVLHIIKTLGLEFRIIPGNHDLTTRHSDWANNASSAFESIGATVVVKPTLFDDDNVVMIPWIESLKDLSATMIDMAEKYPGADCIIHAPINGVLRNIPPHGLDPTNLSHIGFKRVFSGHYHNHVDFKNGVYSIGALTHQTWSDVGTLAGFVIVDDDVAHIESSAPKFVLYDPDDASAMAGNYVKASVTIKASSEIAEYRQLILNQGALGVDILPTMQQQNQRATTNTGATTIRSSVHEWIATNKGASQALIELSDRILLEAEA